MKRKWLEKGNMFAWFSSAHNSFIHSKVSTAFLQQDLPCSCKFEKIQNAGDLKLTEEQI